MDDDEEFDDLLAGVDLLEGSSQESLTLATANLDFYDCESDHDDRGGKFPLSPPSSTYDSAESDERCPRVQYAESSERLVPGDTAAGKDNMEQPQFSNLVPKYLDFVMSR